MPTTLTPQFLKGLKPTAKRQEVRDSGGENLYVVVQPHTGEKSFLVRVTINGEQRKKTIGHFPAMSLAEARETAYELKIALRRGKSLPIQIGPVQAPEPGISVAEAWDFYWQHEACSRKSAPEKERIFKADVKPVLGAKRLDEVSHDDLANLIRAKFLTAKTASNRLHSLLARFFVWCTTHGRPLTHLEANPMASVVKMHSERGSARQRFFDRQEIGSWFEALPEAGVFAPIHELLMRTLCRRSEIQDLAWREVQQHENGDAILVLSAPKNGLPHIVWLHPSAERLLPSRPADAKPTDRVFAMVTKNSRPVDRMRAKMEELAAEQGRTVEHWTIHDYRRTGTTHLAGMVDGEDAPLVPDHILDKLLNHKEQRVVRHYNRYAYYREKKAAIKLWNEFLERVNAVNKYRQDRHILRAT